MWINNRKKEGIYIREILEGYILFLKKGILFWLEYHLELLIVCLKFLSVLMMNLVFCVLFVMILNNDLFGFVSYLFILVIGSFGFYLIDRDRN